MTAPRLVLALAALAFAASGCEGGAAALPASSKDAEAPNGAAVSVELADLQAIDAALAAQRGRGVLLNFWATWCVPCVAELPHLAAVARDYRDRGGVLIGVSYDLQIPVDDEQATIAAVRKFAAARKLEMPVLIFDAPDTQALDERFDLPGPIPVTLAFDREGRLVDRQEGEAGRARLEEMMRKALGI